MADFAQSVWTWLQNQSSLGFASVVVLLLTTGLLVATIWQASGSTLPRLPGPILAKYTDLYRVSLVLTGNMATNFRRLHEKHGPIVQTGPRHVMVCSEEAIEKIYVDSQFQKSDLYDIFQPTWKGQHLDTLISTRSDEWHRTLTRAMAPQMNANAVHSFESVVDEVNAKLISRLALCGIDPQDTQKWMQFWAMDISTHVNFGEPLGYLEQQKDVKGIIEGIGLGFKYGAVIGQMPYLHPYLFGNEAVSTFMNRFAPFGDPVTTLLELSTRAVDQAYGERLQGSMCSLLNQIHDDTSYAGSSLQRIDKVNLLFINIIASSHTTATTLTAILCLLRDNKLAQKQLSEEIRNFEASDRLSNPVTNSEALQMPYLQAVIQESLRLVPANAVTLERTVSTQGLVLSGTYLPVGTRIGVSAAAVHHDPDVFGDDHNSFKPERWLDGEHRDIPRMRKAFFAWSKGKRSCSGRAIAIMQLSKAVVQIVRQFDLTKKPGGADLAVKWWWVPVFDNAQIVFRPRQKKI